MRTRASESGPLPLRSGTWLRGRTGKRALVVAGTVAVGLILSLLLFSGGIPSDELMVSRFEKHPPALVDLCPPTFSTEDAERRWLRALRISGTAVVGDCRGVLYWVSSSEGRSWMFGYHWDDRKGYAWMPGRPEEDVGPLWRVQLPHPLSHYVFRLSPIEGDWYIMKVRMHRP